MAKLAMFSALLLGACVAANDPETAASQLDDDITPTNVVDQVELPQPTPDYLDFGTVIITGIQIPGRESTATHIDLREALEVEAWPGDIEFCAVAEGLNGGDVCSSLCDPDGFIARLHDQGGTNPGGCRPQSCKMGNTIVNLDVCTPANP